MKSCAVVFVIITSAFMASPKAVSEVFAPLSKEDLDSIKKIADQDAVLEARARVLKEEEKAQEERDAYYKSLWETVRTALMVGALIFVGTFCREPAKIGWPFTRRRKPDKVSWPSTHRR